MNFISRYLEKTEFENYKDFIKNYKIKRPDNFNFGYDIIDEYARLQPDKPALVWCDDDLNIKRLSFSDISRESNKAANLFKKLGIGKGDTVMLMLKQRIEAWVCIVALCKLGAKCIPATFQLTPKDIVYRCNAASIKLICCVDDSEMLDNIKKASPECTTLEGYAVVGESIPDGAYDFRSMMQTSSADFEKVDTKIDDIMLIYFSSGTTGMPKMIAHSYDYPLGHITTAKYWQKVEDEGLHLTVSDSGWAKFAWGKIYGQWIAGAVNVAYDTEKFEPLKLLKAMETLKLSTFCAPPTIYRFLIKEDIKSFDLSTIKHCCTAGEPLNPEVINRFKEATGQEIFEGFGQTETTVILGNFGFDPIKQGSTGKPSPIYDIDIVDENGNSCEDGVVGSIVIKNTDKSHPCGLFRGYYLDEAAMKRSWNNGTYNTGDMAWRDSDGYFWFEGRNDDVIKCSGYRIGPFEVESALLTHPSVLECAITAVPDPVRGQVVKATVVLTKGWEPSDELKKELQNHVKKNTAPYKYPRVLEFVKELPKTTSGKIKRGEIRNSDAKK